MHPSCWKRVLRDILDSEYSNPSFPKRPWLGDNGSMTWVGRVTKWWLAFLFLTDPKFAAGYGASCAGWVQICRPSPAHQFLDHFQGYQRKARWLKGMMVSAKPQLKAILEISEKNLIISEKSWVYEFFRTSSDKLGKTQESSIFRFEILEFPRISGCILEYFTFIIQLFSDKS